MSKQKSIFVVCHGDGDRYYNVVYSTRAEAYQAMGEEPHDEMCGLFIVEYVPISRVAAMEEVARLYNIYHLFIEFKLDEFRKAMDAKPDAETAPLVTKLNEKLGRAVWTYRQALAKQTREGAGG